MVTTGAVSRAKLQSNRHHQQTDTQFNFTGRMPFQQCQSTERIPNIISPEAKTFPKMPLSHKGNIQVSQVIIFHGDQISSPYLFCKYDHRKLFIIINCRFITNTLPASPPCLTFIDFTLKFNAAEETMHFSHVSVILGNMPFVEQEEEEDFA